MALSQAIAGITLSGYGGRHFVQQLLFARPHVKWVIQIISLDDLISTMSFGTCE